MISEIPIDTYMTETTYVVFDGRPLLFLFPNNNDDDEDVDLGKVRAAIGVDIGFGLSGPQA